MTYDTINKIVTEKLRNDIDNVIKYNEISIYQGMDGCIEFIQSLTGCDREMAKQIIENDKWLMPNTETPQEYEYRTRKANQEAIENLNKPKCITCGSTNIKKISTSAKVAGAVAFGLFSKTAKSQFKCENCGCKW